jgi:predicted dehydrogenase
VIQLVMIGCGGFARRYHIPAIHADPGIRLAAIYDPMPVPAVQALAAASGAALVATLEALPQPVGTAMVPTGGTTMAIVTTPHTLHAAHVAAALARGWHVLCDKPFVSHASEARALAAEATRRGLTNAVAFNRRFDQGCLRARQALREGAIGALRYVQTVQLGYEKAGWFLDPALGGGGPYTGRASHMADLLPWLLGQRPTALRSRLREGPPGRSDRGGFIELRFGDLECTMTCIEEGWHGWDEVRLFGDDGLIELRRPVTLPIGWAFRLQNRMGAAVECLGPDPEPGGATRDFIAALRDGTPVGCDFAAAATSVQIVEEAFRSAREGDAWRELAP